MTNFQIDPNWRFFLGWVENITGKGEYAGNQHFLLFLQKFSKGLLEVGIVWKWVKFIIQWSNYTMYWEKMMKLTSTTQNCFDVSVRW